jgi:plastocyanin
VLDRGVAVVRKPVEAVVLRLPCLLMLAVAPLAGAAPVTHTVVIQGMAYEPAVIKVKKGDRITWTNKDLFPHTVTAGNRSFDSGEIAAGNAWSYVVTTNAKQNYICSFHPTMKGQLVVQ